jgi:hypothetical protein
VRRQPDVIDPLRTDAAHFTCRIADAFHMPVVRSAAAAEYVDVREAAQEIAILCAELFGVARRKMVGSGKDRAAFEKQRPQLVGGDLGPSYFGDSCPRATRSDCELKFYFSAAYFGVPMFHAGKWNGSRRIFETWPFRVLNALSVLRSA